MEDAELLKPSLSAKDDLVGMGRPWNPWHVVLASLWGGPLLAGCFLGRNYAHLGERAKQRWCMLAFVLLWLGSSAVFVHRIDRTLALDREELTKDSAAFINMVGLVAALIVAKLQARRFRLFVRCGGDPQGFLGYAVLGILAGLFVHSLWIKVLDVWMRM